jgi:4,5-DOPA dioxygenase extradiol
VNPVSPTRRRLLASSAAASALAALSTLSVAARAVQAQSGAPARRMPVIFIGHGSPMNAIRDNPFTRALTAWGLALPRPAAILSVSAHWLSQGGTGVDIQARPATIHDFRGFPQELQEMQYPAPGAPMFARAAISAVKQTRVEPTHEWGLDHGTWTVLKHLYPKADVPVFQLSIDYDQPPAYHYAIGRDLASLREQGVLIMGSGNVVHNLRATDCGAPEGPPTRAWAQEFDVAVKQALAGRDDKRLLAYQALDGANMAVPTPDHYYPFLYALGAAPGEAPRTVFEGFHNGTLSMRCVQFGA